jgi:serine protease
MQSNILKLVSFSIVSATIALPIPSLISPVIAQPVQDEGIYYLYQGQKIYLTAQPNTIAIEFKTPTRTVREIGEDDRPPYLKLETELQKSVAVRGTKPLTVTPIGTNLALINIPPELNNARNLITKRSIAQPFVKQSFPVLTRSGTAENLVVTNELLVSFAADVPETKRQEILKTQNLEIVRPLRFTENHYIVRSQNTNGIGLLKVGNTLRGMQGITAVSPNFIQSIAEPTTRSLSEANTRSTPSMTNDRGLSSILRSDLLPLQWHLDSRSQYPDSLRVDVRAKEAWAISQRGRGVVVAVLDSLIQWDHPDLTNSIVSTEKAPNALPGETSGWDFESDDPDTRISPTELSVLMPGFQEAFKTPGQGNIKNAVGSFHGTMTSSVVSAKAVGRKGIFGIAPEAKVLPVKVVKVGLRSVESKAIADAIPYAALRGADIISMSFGGSVPDEVYSGILAETLLKYPKLVMIAASGNENVSQSAYPAGIQGVISVGAIGPTGYRSSYSNFGNGLDVVAPGGDFASRKQEGFLVAGGTFVDGFWTGLDIPKKPWGRTEDVRGQYIWTQGTSFSAPLVAGIVALMKGEDPDRKLDRSQLIAILKSTASTQDLLVSKSELERSEKIRKNSKLATLDPKSLFFGNGLVNAELAVKETQNAVKKK